MTRKFLILLLLSFFVFLAPAFVFAQGQLEIEYPEFFGISPPQTVKTDIAQYFRYVFYAILTIGGFVALGALVYGGFRYLVSAGSPAALQDARDQIIAALLGMLILFGSWLVLNTINPQLVALRTQLLRPAPTTLSAGIWLCKGKEDKNIEFRDVWQRQEEFRAQEKLLASAATEKDKEPIIEKLRALAEIIKEQMTKINEKCYLAAGSGGIRKDFARSGDYVTQVYSVPRVDLDPQTGKRVFTTYAGFLFEKPNYEGSVRPKNLKDANALFNLAPSSPVQDSVNNNPQSILTITINRNWQPNWEVIACNEVADNLGRCPNPRMEQKFGFDNIYVDKALNPSPKSIRFSHSNSYVAILSKHQDYADPKIIKSSDSNLLGYDQISEGKAGFCPTFWRCETLPAARHIFLISGSIY